MSLATPLPRRHMRPCIIAPGFTLAELLIVMIILGVVVVLTLPLLLNAQQDKRRIAIFRETISAITAVAHQGWQQKALSKGATYWNDNTYFSNTLNSVRICPTASSGCWTMDEPAGANQTAQMGMVLHNGAVVAGLSNTPITQSHNWIVVDWNGASPPNTEGDDQIVLSICYDTDCNTGQRAGTVGAAGGFATSETLFNEIFKAGHG